MEQEQLQLVVSGSSPLQIQHLNTFPLIMNADMVTSNECKNDGSYLHLYFLDSASTWIAYGLSAFGLRLFVKSEGCMSLRGFSKKLQMPCTQVGEDTVPLLLQRAIVVRHISASYLLVRMPDAVDRSAYARWTDKLRGGASEIR